MAIDRRNTIIRTRLATDAAMFLASRLRNVGIDVRVLSREHAERVRESSSNGEEFSVADMQKELYVWNGEAVSLAAFARSFMSQIKQKDRTVEDANRIAEAYIKNVAEDPSKHIPALLPENMSHARYFILRDGSVFGPDNAAWNSPEYQTTRGLYEIYLRVLGEDRMRDYLRLVNPSHLRNDEENARFLSMEREVNGSSLMQSRLELNAEKISAERVRAVRNIIQYFDGNNDYMPLEKALLLKGAMTWGVVDKKDGEKSEVRLVRITDSNVLAVPVIGGDLASVVEGLRHGMDFKDSLKEAIKNRQGNGRRSVPGSYTGWKRYPKSDSEEDAAILNKDVAGTGWCTGGALSTARSHLLGGDFHVYFENGEPLIAIRTEDGRMAEPPRGAHEGQFCTDREEQIAFDYITNPVNGIVAGKEYVNDILDIRRIMSPDATWKDAFNFPLKRRYSNGEFGGDTSSWGDKINRRVDELLNGVSSSERRKLGYYFENEVFGLGSDLSEVKYVRGDIEILDDCSFPFLQSVGGSLIVDKKVSFQADALQSVGGDLFVYEQATLQADALQSVGGNLEVCKNATLQADALQSVGGNLEVCKNATLQAEALQSVGGNLEVCKNATLQAEALQSVGGYLKVWNNATLQANALQSVGRGLYVYNNATLQADALQSVGGYLEVCKNVTLQAEALQSVGGDLFVYEQATLQADALQSVGGYLVVCKNATFQADALQSVGGYLKVWNNATLQANALQSVGRGLYVYNNATLQADALQSVGGDLKVWNNATLQANALQSVGGYLFVYEQASLLANALQSVGGDLVVAPLAKAVHIGIDYSLRDGTVYGYAIGDVIYLTPDGINPETPIHEYTHLWARVLEKNSPEQWAELVDSLRNSIEWSVVHNDSYYSNICNDDSRLASEVLARLCGRKGAELLERAAGESDGTVAGTVSEFRRLVDSNVMPAVFGTKGERLTEKATLAVLQDFAEGRRNSLAEVSMMPGSYHDIRRKNSSGMKNTRTRRRR